MADSDSALASAIEALKQGQFSETRSVCKAILNDDPECAKAWHLSGIANAQLNQLADAAECFEKATQLRSDVASYHYNLGLAYQSLNDFQGAIGAYQAAVRLKPEFLEAQNNLGNCYVETKDLESAVEHFRELSESFVDESVVQYNLANVLQDSGEVKESIALFKRAIELDPDFSTARENLGRALSDVELFDQAEEVWREWLEHDPDNAVAKHMVASVTGDDTPDRCDDEYVRETFDQDFAKSYEQQLERIQYKVPELIGEAIQSLALDGELDILDAGCGTGLCAAILKPLSRSLVGIDLSSDMLTQAERREVYDELHEHELTDFLRNSKRHYNLIISGDTLCYFGDLGDVLAGFSSCLHTGGHLVFTVERCDEDCDEESDTGNETFRLQPNGRYRHVEAYVREQIEAAGLKIKQISTGTLRMERGRVVEGLIVTAQR